MPNLIRFTIAILISGNLCAKSINNHYPVNLEPLKQKAFVKLPLGAVKPKGWLKRQLQIQADGLTGHLDEFWMYDSWWKGGSEHGHSGGED